MTALAVSASAAVASCEPDPAQGALATVSSLYDKPGELVRLPDGRRLNLRCSGRGSPTVLLESGFGAWASAWTKVQPELARVTRVCAYDRAGYGFSDIGPPPRDGAAIARDLDQALQAAKVDGPFVVVGHSAGALYGRLFAARRAGEVQGLVLLDPTVERLATQSGPDGLDGIRRRLNHCIQTASSQPPPPQDDAAWKGCLSSTAGRQAAMRAHDPGYWRSQLSEIDNIFGRTSEQVSRTGGVLADVPVYVFTASQSAGAAPRLGFGPAVTPLEAQHQELAALSRIGYQRTVLSSHLIMIDRPDVVIEAVAQMVAAAREHRAPDPPATSETRTLPDSDALKDLLTDKPELQPEINPSQPQQ